MVPGIPPAPGRRAAPTLVVLAVVLAASAIPVAGAGPTTPDPSTDPGSPSKSGVTPPSAGPTAASLAVESGAPPLRVTATRSGSTVRFRAVVNALSGGENVRLDGRLGPLNITRSAGFVPADGGYRLREGRDRGTLVAVLDLSEPRATSLGAVGPGGPFQAGDRWAFAPSPRFALSWTANGTTVERRLAPGAAEGSGRVPFDADGPVAVGDRFVLFGPHEAVESGDGTRLILPAAASFDAGPDRALSLAAAAYREAGTEPDGPVTAFVLPRRVRAGGAASGTDLWLRADAADRTVAHEFAHAALDLRTTERTRWLGEAAAEYVAYRVAGPEDVTGTLLARVVEPDATLADRDSWGSEAVPYRHGAAVLALLDERVRAATDGERSVRAVFAALSEADRVDAGTLHDSVVGAADEPTAAWLSAHAAGERRVDAAAGSDRTGTPGAAQRLPGGGTAAGGPVTAAVGLFAASGAVVVFCWTLLRCGYRLLRRLRSAVAV